jgi:hypothetical protein
MSVVEPATLGAADFVRWCDGKSKALLARCKMPR